MPSLTAPGQELRDRLHEFDEAVVSREERLRALDTFFAARSGREKSGRYWRIDLESIVPSSDFDSAATGAVHIENTNARAIACDLTTAARDHADLLARAFGATSVSTTKFGALATAFAQLGAFVYLPQDVASDVPIAIVYDVPRGATAFPYTVVLAERGARGTIVERCRGGEGGASVFGATEIVTGENSDVVFTGVQELDESARIFQTRMAVPGKDARITWAAAELGAALTVSDVSVSIVHHGVEAHTTALFFPHAGQHVDMISSVDHQVGDTTSETIVKSAAADNGQARYLGNIRIAPLAQGSNASLRDDALLLSDKAHIDSVPALEIGANDVKAYHGATVGALDADQIFYMQSRGIERNAAERMIALGFFEPAIERFPTNALREELRAALQAKLP